MRGPRVLKLKHPVLNFNPGLKSGAFYPHFGELSNGNRKKIQPVQFLNGHDKAGLTSIYSKAYSQAE